MALWKQNANNLNNINLYSNGTVTIDAVSIKEITEEYYDRSVNQYHLLRYGTITRSAVSTGADLVAYSGWSDSNFLRQPYNADLNYGTGDFFVMGWFKMPDVSQLGFIFDRASLTNTGGGSRFAVYTESSQLKFYVLIIQVIQKKAHQFQYTITNGFVLYAIDSLMGIWKYI